LRDKNQLQSFVQALDAGRRWTGFLEPDEEHDAYAILIGLKERDLGKMRIDWDLLGGSDFQALVKLDRGLEDFKSPPHRLEWKDQDKKFPSLEALVEFILEEGQNGITIQRFKGLGEMNPEQLWETAMDPETRTLLKVNIEDAAEADQIFTILMGDKVEPRREFIQNNVLELSDLDI
jgi:DNA gyrase subunit B